MCVKSEREFHGHPIFAALYDFLLGPAEKRFLGPHRAYLCGGAGGQVLDVGCGTGLNFGYYPPAVEVVGIEPDPYMLKRAQARAEKLGKPIKLLAEVAEELSFPDASFDTAVMTLVFCTLPDVPGALRELRRVLRPGGQLRFLEHIRAETPGWAGFQDLMVPIWRRIGAECHPNRDTVKAIEGAGFRIDELNRYAFGPYPARPFVRGVAKRV
jgi:ubiquinone/menaquinone biosynthesis C-methylase UbiE